MEFRSASWVRCDFKDFREYLPELYGDDLKGNISYLHDLMRRRLIGRKSGPLGGGGGRISKFLMYGENQMPETQVQIAKIREAIGEFVRRQKERRQFRKKNYQSRMKVVAEVVKDFRARYKSSPPYKRNG